LSILATTWSSIALVRVTLCGIKINFMKKECAYFLGKSSISFREH
jgi:hypothetical protein